jgi:DNA-binding transcriptional MerR regulator
MKKNGTEDKMYYSISEVARITGLEPYVLRYWEKEFPTLCPKKSRGGNRIYTSRDIELVNRIKHLRTQEKLTIAGARNKLAMRRPSEEKTTMVVSAKTKTLIGRIRKDIEDILENFS